MSGKSHGQRSLAGYSPRGGKELDTTERLNNSKQPVKNAVIVSGEQRRDSAVQDSLLPQGFPGGSVVTNPPAKAGDEDLIPGLGRSPGIGNDNPLQYSCLGNPMDRGAKWATVHGVAELDMTECSRISPPNCPLIHPGRLILNRWTTREVPGLTFFQKIKS